MDGESFDRLSVIVHRLRNKTTRRRALGVLLSGSVAAVSGKLADDAGARDRNRTTTAAASAGSARQTGTAVPQSADTDAAGLAVGAVVVVVVRSVVAGRIVNPVGIVVGPAASRFASRATTRSAAESKSFANGYQCCGGSGGACPGGVNSCTGQFGICCQSGWKYCNSGFYKGQCIPKDWSCNDLSHSSQSDDIAAESTEKSRPPRWRFPVTTGSISKSSGEETHRY